MRQLKFLILVLLVGSAAAQFTTVTGTVTDPNGLPYAFGTIATRIVSTGTPLFQATSQPYLQPSQPTGLDTSGKFSLRLADVASLTPGGSTYTFTVCSFQGTVLPSFGKGSLCFTVTGVTITGSTQDISATLNAAAPALTANFGTGSGCTLVSSNANGVVFLNAGLNCTSSPDFTFAGADNLSIGSSGTPGSIQMQGTGGNSYFISGSKPYSLNSGVNTPGGSIGISTGNNPAVIIGVPGSIDHNSISTISRTANLVTVVCSSGCDYPVGAFINTSGVTDSSFNGGPFQLLTSNAGTYTYNQTAANASSSGGFLALATSNRGVFATTGALQGLNMPLFFYGSSNTDPLSNGIGMQFTVGACTSGGCPGGNINFVAGDTQSGVGSASAGSINFTAGSGRGSGNNSGGTINMTVGSPNGSGVAGKVTIAGGLLQTPSATIALSTTAIGANTCAAAQTQNLTGLTTSSVVKWSFASTPIGVTGYGTGGLQITTFATSNTANVVVCNITAGSITPGTMSLNLRGEL